ncbi:MAG: hypothetical protein V3T86_01925 [Planctomycetota bacterium]
MSFRSFFSPLPLVVAGAVVALLLTTLALARDSLKRTEPFASLYLDFRAARDNWPRPDDLGDGAATSGLTLVEPTGIAVDDNGNLYIGDRGTHLVWRITRAGHAEVFAGTGGTWSLTEGPALLCDLDEPEGLALAPDESLLVALEQKHMVVRIDTDGVLHKLAGLGRNETSGDGGPAKDAGLDYPTDVACAPDGTVYIATADGARIRAVGHDGIIRTVAGGGEGEFVEGMPATEIALREPYGVLVDKHGHLLLTDSGHHRVLRLIDGHLHLVAGTGEAGHSGDGGDAKFARLDSPQSLVQDAQGRLVINDEHNKCVRRIELDGTIRTILGRGHPVGAPVELAGPEHLALAKNGSIYVTDGLNGRVWRIAPSGSATVYAGQSLD